MPRIISLDTETFRIGPGAIAPKMVCFTTAERAPDGSFFQELVGNGDAEVEQRLAALLVDENVQLVLHNSAYDLTVIATSYPDLEPLIWEAVEAGRITDTMIREMLLNLSTHGHLESMFLPDGSAAKLSYSLATLVLKYLGIDLSALKEGDDIWRLNYDTLDGLPGKKYPRDAVDYALGDAQYTLQVYEAQEESKGIEGQTETEHFQTASAFALRWITLAGMATDPTKFEEMRAMLDEELSEDKLQPLVEAGIMRSREPARPHARQAKKAIEMLAEWTGQADFTAVEIEAWRPELEEAGIKFTDEKPSGIYKEALTKRVMAAQLALGFGDTVETYLGMEVEEQVALANASEVDFKRTDKGAPSTDSEVIDMVADVDDVLGVYQHRQKLQKLVSTEIPRMMWDGKLAPTVHWPFKVLLETGRTSSSADKLFPSGNGQQIHPKVRPIFVPREHMPGKRGLFISCDYSTLELVCVAQITYDLFGYSVHRDKINAGYDLHAYLGAQLALKLSPEFRGWLQEAGVDVENADEVYDLFRSLKKEQPDFYGHWRKFAKPIGLGFPGGLGPYKILTLAKKTYKVDIVAEAEKLFLTNPEMFNRSHSSVVYWAKKLYKLPKTDTSWTPTLKGIALAALMRDFWFETYPEMREFLKVYLPSNAPARRKSDSDEFDADNDRCFTYTSPMGMLRAGCTYTSAANGQVMQTPAAEGFKAAFFNLVKECRLGRLVDRALVVDEIHDELLVEVFEPSDLCAVATIVKQVMETSMTLVISDVKVTAEPAAMESWMKEAEARYDSKGRLVPWRPKKAGLDYVESWHDTIAA